MDSIFSTKKYAGYVALACGHYMKPLFSSLGSNYSFSDALLSIEGVFVARFFPGALARKYADIKTFFDATYGGETYFFYKGRDAIECALRAYDIARNDGVITQAFACYAVEEAITRVGAVPVYADIAEHSANLSLQTIKVAHAAASVPIKAVIIQYSLGSIPDAKKIATWCKKNDIVLIEDVAQGYGGETEDKDLVGTLGDVTVFSFGRDKVLDAVTGGACCFRTATYKQLTSISNWYATLHVQARSSEVFSQHLYPLLTWKIRTTFTWGISVLTVGKVLAFLSRKLGVIRTPLYASTTKASLLPHSFLPLLAKSINSVEEQLAHRKTIVKIYDDAFGGTAATIARDEVMNGSGLRYPIIVKDPEKVARAVRAQRIYISDRWYRAAVDCSSEECNSQYKKGSAARAESLAQHVLTLPTHLGISVEDAHRIVESIKAVHS